MQHRNHGVNTALGLIEFLNSLVPTQVTAIRHLRLILKTQTYLESAVLFKLPGIQHLDIHYMISIGSGVERILESLLLRKRPQLEVARLGRIRAVPLWEAVGCVKCKNGPRTQDNAHFGDGTRQSSVEKRELGSQRLKRGGWTQIRIRSSACTEYAFVCSLENAESLKMCDGSEIMKYGPSSTIFQNLLR